MARRSSAVKKTPPYPKVDPTGTVTTELDNQPRSNGGGLPYYVYPAPKLSRKKGFWFAMIWFLVPILILFGLEVFKK